MTADDADRLAVLDSLFGLSGKAVIVTGAGRGLGRELALAITAAGASVVAVSRTAGQLDATVQLAPGGRMTALAWDVTQLERGDELIERAHDVAGPIHGIVHAAGIQHRSPAAEFGVEDWSRVTRVDLDAPFFLSTALHRRQQRDGRAGSHVFVGSLTSYLGIKGISAYAASKSGLFGIIRTLAVEWAETGTRVNGLAPGYFHTELTEALFADAERAAWVRSRIPVGRLGVAADLSGAVIYLLSAAAGYVTGQMLNIDGGWLAG